MSRLIKDIIKELRPDWINEELQSALEEYEYYKTHATSHICMNCGDDITDNHYIEQCPTTGYKTMFCECGSPEEHTRHYGIEEFLDNVL